MTFFKFPPYFRCFSTFPPVSRKLLFPPYFDKFPPSVLHKFTCFLYTLRVFRFPLTFTMMHLCITQCTYRKPLSAATNKILSTNSKAVSVSRHIIVIYYNDRLKSPGLHSTTCDQTAWEKRRWSPIPGSTPKVRHCEENWRTECWDWRDKKSRKR